MKLIQGTYPKSKKHVHNMMNGSYFEFSLPYVEESFTFREIDRFNDESRRLTRFKNRYTGNVAVNITEWADKPLNCYFTAFVCFLLDRMLDYPSSQVALICETVCSRDFVSSLEELFMEKIEITDLGVKASATDKKVIGFVPFDGDSTGKKPEEDRIV